MANLRTAAVFFLLVSASLSELWTTRIPNSLVGIGLLGAFALALADRKWLAHGGGFMLAAIPALVAFAYGWMGGGGAKLLMVTGACAGAAAIGLTELGLVGLFLIIVLGRGRVWSHAPLELARSYGDFIPSVIFAPYLTVAFGLQEITLRVWRAVRE